VIAAEAKELTTSTSSARSIWISCRGSADSSGSRRWIERAREVKSERRDPCCSLPPFHSAACDGRGRWPKRTRPVHEAGACAPGRQRKKLQQYILDEREQIEVRGPARVSCGASSAILLVRSETATSFAARLKVNGVASAKQTAASTKRLSGSRKTARPARRPF